MVLDVRTTGPHPIWVMVGKLLAWFDLHGENLLLLL